MVGDAVAAAGRFHGNYHVVGDPDAVAGDSKYSIMRLNGHRLRAHEKETAFDGDQGRLQAGCARPSGRP